MDEPKPTFQPNVGSKDKSVGWYDQTFHGIEPAARALLEEYSHIPSEEVDQYVISMVRSPKLYFSSHLPLRTHTGRQRDN